MASAETVILDHDGLAVPRIVGCFLMHNGRFPILHRALDKPQGGTWGLPAGRVEPGESDVDAVTRELLEETGHRAHADELVHLGTFRFGEQNADTGPYDFAVYQANASQRPSVRLEQGVHSSVRWVTPEQCYARDDLIADFHPLLRHVGYIAL